MVRHLLNLVMRQQQIQLKDFQLDLLLLLSGPEKAIQEVTIFTRFHPINDRVNSPLSGDYHLEKLSF